MRKWNLPENRTDADDVELETALQKFPLNLLCDAVETDMALGGDNLGCYASHCGLFRAIEILTGLRRDGNSQRTERDRAKEFEEYREETVFKFRRLRI